MAVRVEDKILSQVLKPARYTGGEYNMVKKNIDEVKIRFAFAFPDIYEVGMSHLGLQIMYHVINLRKDTYCERVFAPWVDMEKVMRENSIPLFTLETKENIRDMDIVGFTLQYEMSYTNIINMLDLAGIPVLAKDRDETFPIICAGGPCTVNPEPVAEIFDYMVIGDGEEVINEILDEILRCKKEGLKKKEILKRLSLIGGVYVPGLYNVTYNENGTIKEFNPVNNNYPEKIKRRIIKDLNSIPYPVNMIVPFIQPVFDRITLEIFRGCIRGCRFCQAGFIYRPVRERSIDVLLSYARQLIENTGYDEISLASLSTSDYSRLYEFLDKLLKICEENMVNLSLPSLRVDNFTLDLMERAKTVRKAGLTFAPEAGTQRLRDVINKGVNEKDFEDALKTAFNGGWSRVKLYYMLGLPTENNRDIEGIAEMIRKAKGIYDNTPAEKKRQKLNITVSTSFFVPKPFTPFQWEAQNTIGQLNEKRKYLEPKLKIRPVKYNWHEPELSFLEGVISRGDRRVLKGIIKAWESGCRFDGWNEHFKFDAWMEAFNKTNIDPLFYTNRKREYAEILPWDHIDIGIKKEFLIRESEKSKKGITTSNCREACSGCGLSTFCGGGACE